MIDKIGPPIAKAFAPIIKLIGKNHSKKEKENWFRENN